MAAKRLHSQQQRVARPVPQRWTCTYAGVNEHLPREGAPGPVLRQLGFSAREGGTAPYTTQVAAQWMLSDAAIERIEKIRNGGERGHPPGLPVRAAEPGNRHARLAAARVWGGGGRAPAPGRGAAPVTGAARRPRPRSRRSSLRCWGGQPGCCGGGGRGPVPGRGAAPGPGAARRPRSRSRRPGYDVGASGPGLALAASDHIARRVSTLTGRTVTGSAGPAATAAAGWAVRVGWPDLLQRPGL